MRVPVLGLLSPAVVAAIMAAASPAHAQTIALPLRGEGEFTLPDKQIDVRSGSVLLNADSSVKVFFIDAGALLTAFVGEWRRADARTVEFAVLDVPGQRNVQGNGRIHFRADGAIDALDVRGQADGREFSARFDSGMNTAAVSTAELRVSRQDPSPGQGSRAAPAPRQDSEEWPWGGSLHLVDVTRRGEGVLQNSEGAEYHFDRARLVLGENDEFQLTIVGDTKMVLAGTWSGDLRFGPVPLDLREAFGGKVEGMGRVWIRDRSWDRDFTLERIELDGWSNGHRFTMYFEAKTPPGDAGSQ
jgi:hypothetical protein